MNKHSYHIYDVDNIYCDRIMKNVKFQNVASQHIPLEGFVSSQTWQLGSLEQSICLQSGEGCPWNTHKN